MNLHKNGYSIKRAEPRPTSQTLRRSAMCKQVCTPLHSLKFSPTHPAGQKEKMHSAPQRPEQSKNRNQPAQCWKGFGLRPKDERAAREVRPSVSGP